jgi:hypothetical protein
VGYKRNTKGGRIMKCTDKEWDTCQVEKMGCNGCYYDEIEIGDYVRTRGTIGKLTRIEFDKIDVSLKWYVLDTGKSKEVYVNKPYIEKWSKNLIDLIEIGDVVECVIEVVAGEEDTEKFEVAATGVKDIKGSSTNEIGICGENGVDLISFEFVRKILTHEQYQENCFEVVQK